MGVIVTPFGQLEYGRALGLSEWLAAHDNRHRLYQNELMGQSYLINLVPLTGQLNEDWFGRHLVHHMALTDALPNPVTPSTSALSKWTDEQSFYSWHDLHTLLHQQLDNALNLT